MSRRTAAIAVGLSAVVALAVIPALAGDQKQSFRTDLSGFEEVPAVSSTGHGSFEANLSQDGTALEYTLSYADLEGTDTLFAHVHLGQRSVNGGVIAFLCGGGGKPLCTDTSGTVSGTIVAADVIGPAGQGIAAGEFEELLRGLRDDVVYANVHTNKHPGGEIRGQVH